MKPTNGQNGGTSFGIEARVSHVEQSVARVEQSVESLNSQIVSVANQVRNMSDSVSGLATQMGRTNFSVLGIWTGIVLTVIGAFGGLVKHYGQREIDAIERHSLKVEAESKESFKAFDASLQREMRLLDDAMKEEIKGLRGDTKAAQDKAELNSAANRSMIRDLESFRLQTAVAIAVMQTKMGITNGIHPPP